MRNKARQRIITMCECAISVALATVLGAIKLFEMPQGGSVTVGMLPIIYFAYRRGTKWGLAGGGLYSVLQILLGWYMPPANTAGSVIVCIVFDYLLAFGLVGIAPLFAKIFGKYKLAGWTVGAVAVCVIRFMCSFISGITIWASFAPEGQPVWIYSIVYNGSYMLPTAVVTAVTTCVLCAVLSPETLKPYKHK